MFCKTKILAEIVVKVMVGFGKLSHQEAQQQGNLVLSYKHNALNTVKNLFLDWEPSSQAFMINYGSSFACAAASLGGLVYGHHLTRVLPGMDQSQLSIICVPPTRIQHYT